MASVAKEYHLTFDYVLYSMSWVNTLMYNAVLPSYNSKKSDKGKSGNEKQEIISADDPANRDKVFKILHNYE